jgi:hypothetical protein
LQVDAKQSSSETHRILIYALVASLVAHLCGLLYFQSDNTLVSSLPATPKPSVFNVTLKTLKTPQRVEVSTTEVKEAAEEIVTTLSKHDSPRLATYYAGNWTEWVQFGNTCFYLKRANPLEPYSNEVWYKTACHQAVFRRMDNVN